MVIVSWDKVCTPSSKGHLSIRNLSKLNGASNLNLCWELLHSNDHWETLIRHRVLRKRKTIGHHTYSSIWSCMKHKFQMVLDNSSWLLGDGSKINFWINPWCGLTFVDLVQNVNHENSTKVKHFVTDGIWNLSQKLCNNHPFEEDVYHLPYLSFYEDKNLS